MKYIYLFLAISSINYQLHAADMNSENILDPWFEAVGAGDLENIKKLIEKVDINTREPQFKMTALMIASLQGHDAIVEFLLQQSSINVLAQSKGGGTALMLAAGNGHEKIVRLLLPRSNLHTKDKKGNTALDTATIRNQLKIVKLFITEFGMNVNARGQKECTPLILAVQCGHTDIVKYLLTITDIDINIRAEHGGSAFSVACFSGHEEIVQLLLKMPGIDVNNQNQFGATGLMQLVTASESDYSKRINILKLLLEFPGINLVAKLNKLAFVDKDLTALDLAKKHIEAHKLIKNKINQLNTKAFDAIKRNDIETLKSAVAQIGLDDVLDASNNTLVDKAFESNSPEIIEYLLQQAKNPQKLLERFPFEYISPSTELFKYFFNLAYTDTKSEKSCHICGKPASKHCSRCKKVYYCSSECQKADWQNHKHNCKLS